MAPKDVRTFALTSQFLVYFVLGCSSVLMLRSLSVINIDRVSPARPLDLVSRTWPTPLSLNNTIIYTIKACFYRFDADSELGYYNNTNT